jgi:hypothetical protein
MQDSMGIKNTLVEKFGALSFEDQTEVLRRMLDLRGKQIDKLERDTAEKNGESWIGSVDDTQYTVVAFDDASCKLHGDSGGRPFNNKAMAEEWCKALKDANPGVKCEVIGIQPVEPSNLSNIHYLLKLPSGNGNNDN